ncbi:hypothetical protein FSP39_020183 [Pinctada imbricata]|uniref:HEAT repeat-containing protein 5A n=1 Tax=Pinctada imbricata TaxID=66713 RepID=A0AA88Y452_PINIB|nr:hypothetical protein FSP39_020183 [Pinctada imbricata]
MELAHSLLLNEEALTKIPDSKKPVFVFEWLRFLDKVLIAAQKSDIKEKQKKLVFQLTCQISESPGPPTRKLLARNLATLFSVGDTFDLFETINKCNDIIKNRDDSPSYLPTKLAAIACLGSMYEKLGRMTGRSYEETVQILIKSLKNAESQGRNEAMLTLEKVVEGLGSAGSGTYKDIYKAAKQCMTDRSMVVRVAAAKCMYQLVNEAPFIHTAELETVTSLCFKALDGSNYDVRCSVAKLLGNLMATAHNPPKSLAGKSKQAKLEDVLNLLASGFIKGGIGFLKSSSAGDMIKGSTNINREIRVGVTHAYIEFVKQMGGLWLERNISVFLNHVLELVANPKATPSHVDAVYARKCVLFIVRSAIGGLLGEKAQIAAAKEICQIIIKQMNVVGEAVADNTDGKTSHSDVIGSQHVLVCALHELGSLVLRLGTSASPLVAEPATGIIEPVVSVLIHPSHAARLAASWCLGSISVALPSQLTPLLDRCVERMDKLKSSPEAVSGYSSALAALLGGVYQCPLGIPHAKGKQLFNLAEDLLRTASQNSRLSLQRTQSGWLLLGALMTLGPPVVRNHLPRMLLLWRNAFPRSQKELESEKARGDAFTWQVTLEARAGALGAMQSFLLHCRELVTEDVIRRLLAPLDCALLMFSHLPWVIKQYGTHLKASAAMVRLRLYDVLSLLPPESYEGTYTHLLRELVAEFTLTDNPANTTTSLLRSMCHVDDSVILGSWLQETDHKAIEDQLQPNSASGSGALEHDSQSLYSRCPPSDPIPGPLPLGVAVIDSSVKLYGLVFPRVAHKHRFQMLQHFNECIKSAKSARQQAVQMNIFTAVLCALKGALSSTNPILRCAAGEALGRMAQVVGDSRFIADMAQYSFNSLKSARDVVSRTGHSLALGCLHRYVGGMGSGQHLNTSVSILLALAQDFNSPVVQVWALHALALIADSGGPMFRSYVEPTLSLVLQLLLSVPPSTVDVHQCLGKCLSALITSIGPELQGNTSSIATARLYCLVCCAIMQDHPDSLVQAEAIACLQQLHMFAPRHVNLTSLVPHLCATLGSAHLLLRRAAVACLRQLVTREAKEVSDLALTLAVDSNKPDLLSSTKPDVLITETGLEGVLYGMMDTETDGKLISDVQDTLVSLLQSLATKNLTRWLLLLKDVLSASTDTTSSVQEGEGDQEDKDDDEDQDEDAGIGFKAAEPDVTHPTVAPRWPTRVFASDCLQRIIIACEGEEAHFDLDKARELKARTSNSNYLVLHLAELVRMAFIAATSDSNQLRLAGLAALQDVITKFAAVPEPEFPGHVILEQFQAQVSAALRPAFSPDTPSDVTAAACDVCSTWIGSGVARDLNDLRRVHQLLVSSLAKLNAGKSQSMLYNESAVTMEKLAVLGAWAEVYIVAVEREKTRNSPSRTKIDDDDYGDSSRESLLSLVQPELPTLSQNWFCALRDYAYLSLPPEYSSQLPPEGGTFYHPDTIESARPHYKKLWPSILHALAIWLHETGFSHVEGSKDVGNEKSGLALPPANAPTNVKREELNADRLHLILGICVEALTNPQTVLSEHTVNGCLKAIAALLKTDWPKKRIGEDPALCKEILNVMHRMFLTRESYITQLLAVEVVKGVLNASLEILQQEKKKTTDKSVDIPPSNSSSTESIDTTDSAISLGEGGETGEIDTNTSVVYAALEVCLCVISRQIPALNPSSPSTGFQVPTHLTKMSDKCCEVISGIVLVMAELPALCSPQGAVAVLPTVLHLTIGVLREMSPRESQQRKPTIVAACLSSLKCLCTSPFQDDDSIRAEWIKLLQSALATILHHARPCDDKPGMDDVTLLAAISLFLVRAPQEVANNLSVQTQCIDVFRETWAADSLEIKLKSLQMFTSVVQHRDTESATPFIRGVAGKILEYLLKLKDEKTNIDSHIGLIIAAVNLTEILVGKADDEKRINILQALLPILVSFLMDENVYKSASPATKTLHDEALQKLIKIGPLYPRQFRAIMPPYRPRLEAAIKLNQTMKAKSAQYAANAKANTQKAAQLNKPTITLKTDFSNFPK